MTKYMGILELVLVIGGQLQMGVVEMLMESKWRQASQVHDHIIIAHHPNAFRYCF
jgi:hypothetical protein